MLSKVKLGVAEHHNLKSDQLLCNGRKFQYSLYISKYHLILFRGPCTKSEIMDSS